MRVWWINNAKAEEINRKTNAVVVLRLKYILCQSEALRPEIGASNNLLESISSPLS